MGGCDGIRVAVRFRPMNKVESKEDGCHICIKISGCRRAVRITHPDRPDRPLNFYMDQIYPPGVSQIDCYTFTGIPLVDAARCGFNSTIFAYGQTGSGKTFSMMGVLGNEDLKGLVPRIIEDLFAWITGLPDDDPNEFNVCIMMCEIYMERIKDLFNSANDNMKVREDNEGGVYVEDVTMTYCQSTAEVLDNMDQGFMNRATSATRMNAESSRSHCVVIIGIEITKPGGGKKTNKVKMVDLAGSEKTKKTAATGQRLEEAKAINQSLSALGNVMTALTDGGFIPYRNSKLTRLLQDALGGNSKTSLIVCASPVSYNAEETISTLRFGARAKLVKNKPKINEELTIDEYKKKVKKLEAKIKVLEHDNKLMKMQLEAVAEWMNSNGGDYENLIADIKIVEEEEDDDKPPECDFDNCQEVSSQVFVIDKKTGKLVGGSAFSQTIGGTPEDAKARDEEEALKKEEERIELMMKAENDPNAYRAMMGRLATGGKGGGNLAPGELAKLAGDKDDLTVELEIWKEQAEDLEELYNNLAESCADKEEMIKNLEVRASEFKLFKQKAQFMVRENELNMAKLLAEVERLKIEVGDDGDDDDDDESDDGNDIAEDTSVNGRIRTKIRELQKRVAQKDKLINCLRLEAKRLESTSEEDLVKNINFGDANKKKALVTLLKTHKNVVQNLMEKKQQNASLERSIEMLRKRESCNDQLRDSWRDQLAQMETAVVTCSQVHQKDKQAFKERLAEHDSEIVHLKEYIVKMSQDRKEKREAAKTAGSKPGRRSRGDRGAKPGAAGGREGRKSRRRSRAVS